MTKGEVQRTIYAIHAVEQSKKCVSQYRLGYSKLKNYMENHTLMTHMTTPS